MSKDVSRVSLLRVTSFGHNNVMLLENIILDGWSGGVGRVGADMIIIPTQPSCSWTLAELVNNKLGLFKVTLEFSVFKLSQIPSAAFIKLHNLARLGCFYVTTILRASFFCRQGQWKIALISSFAK